VLIDRLESVADIDGLTLAEEHVLGPLEDSPMPLWEIAEAFVRGVAGEHPTTEALAGLLGPALVSLAGNGLIEVRRFGGWPAPWECGDPVTAENLAGWVTRVDLWSRDATHDALVAHITDVGGAWL
jgi:hypothetical protein